LKRLLDLSLAISALIILSPVIVFVSILILFNLGLPIIFKQKRIGLKGKTFFIYKFRTMKESLKEGNEAERLTSLTSLLRNYSLDELPTLWNVILNDMSFVGPRPLLEDYRNEYTSEQFKRHDVLPGISGWAQINGRNTISWEEKFKLDLWYVENKSFILDLKIICLTVLKIFDKTDVNQSSRNTMERFRRYK
jgi:sugar transferase EpsL